jgi:hypothetical protein
MLKAAKEKDQVTYKGKPTRITDFLEDTLDTMKAWNDVSQVFKENDYQPRLLYPAKLYFKIEGQIKTFF